MKRFPLASHPTPAALSEEALHELLRTYDSLCREHSYASLLALREVQRTLTEALEQSRRARAFARGLAGQYGSIQDLFEICDLIEMLRRPCARTAQLRDLLARLRRGSGWRPR